jgi:hypothetical protein
MFARVAPKPSAITPVLRLSVRSWNSRSILQRSAFSITTDLRNMATGSKIHLEAAQQPQFYVKGLREDSAKKASELLQENHEKHDIFFNQGGFHVRIYTHLYNTHRSHMAEPHRPPRPHPLRPQCLTRTTTKSLRRKRILPTPTRTSQGLHRRRHARPLALQSIPRKREILP